jgi:hypothetical protein
LQRRRPAVAVKGVTLFCPCNTADHLARDIAKLLVDEKPDVLILLAATVDAIRRIEPGAFREALRALG